MSPLQNRPAKGRLLTLTLTLTLTLNPSHIDPKPSVFLGSGMRLGLGCDDPEHSIPALQQRIMAETLCYGARAFWLGSCFSGAEALLIRLNPLTIRHCT